MGAGQSKSTKAFVPVGLPDEVEGAASGVSGRIKLKGFASK